MHQTITDGQGRQIDGHPSALGEPTTAEASEHCSFKQVSEHWNICAPVVFACGKRA
jgi:hypothetical protein